MQWPCVAVGDSGGTRVHGPYDGAIALWGDGAQWHRLGQWGAVAVPVSAGEGRVDVSGCGSREAYGGDVSVAVDGLPHQCTVWLFVSMLRKMVYITLRQSSQ